MKRGLIFILVLFMLIIATNVFALTLEEIRTSEYVNFGALFILVFLIALVGLTNTIFREHYNLGVIASITLAFIGSVAIFQKYSDFILETGSVVLIGAAIGILFLIVYFAKHSRKGLFWISLIYIILWLGSGYFPEMKEKIPEGWWFYLNILFVLCLLVFLIFILAWLLRSLHVTPKPLKEKWKIPKEKKIRYKIGKPEIFSKEMPLPEELPKPKTKKEFERYMEYKKRYKEQRKKLAKKIREWREMQRKMKEKEKRDERATKLKEFKEKIEDKIRWLEKWEKKWIDIGKRIKENYQREIDKLGEKRREAYNKGDVNSYNKITSEILKLINERDKKLKRVSDKIAEIKKKRWSLE